jgi:hypothetical protein
VSSGARMTERHVSDHQNHPSERASAHDRVEPGALVDRLEQRRNNPRFRDEALCRKVVSAGDQYGRQAGPDAASALHSSLPSISGRFISTTMHDSIKAGEAATVVLVDDDPSVLRALSRLIVARRIFCAVTPQVKKAAREPSLEGCLL